MSSTSWKQRGKLIVALLIPVFLETLDYTVVATAQPQVASAFNSLDLQSWIGTSYVLTSTVFLPIYASIADVFGRHWAAQLSLLFFLIGSALCTGAQNMPMLLAGRGISGVGAAGMLTVTRIILSDSTSLDDNNWQTAMLVILYAVGYTTGPIIGGALTSVNWRWIFAINLPCTVVASILILLLLRKTIKKAQPPRRLQLSGQVDSTYTESYVQKINRIDWLGASLFIASGILILLGLNWGSTSKWNSAKVIVSFVIGGLLMLAFVAWEYLLELYEQARCTPPKALATTEAMIPLVLFRNYDVVATCFASLASGMLMFGCFYFLSIYFIIVAGFSPTKSGSQLLYFSPGLGGGVLISTQMIRLFRQPKYPIILGGILQCVGVGLLSMGLQANNHGQINGFLALCGVSVGLCFGPLAMHARFCQPEDRVAIVVTLNLFFRTAGGTIGLAQLAAVLNSKVTSYIHNLAASGTLSPAIVSQLSLAGGSLDSVNTISSLSPDILVYVRDAFQYAVRWAFISLIPWCGISFFLVLFLSKIPDTDVAREGDRDAIVEKKMSPSIAPSADDRDIEAGPAAARVHAAASGNEDAAPRPQRPKRAPPRFKGPINMLIYGIQLLVDRIRAH
ncbi:hypothetical protein BOTBODRAFT_138939 [Botryobasidium botryosum FD-172 SS1]|uniref:Major facilitator superfamily (MFS) profile domain-containing protein n=1 Tax=Botryobasidium botryosum (strain FD-172 SS1) TaxID=930990 RepID=A0A067M9E9_BOTB1|nr:hypothetical protein BOTBODRAFT_138939 [Botryobasidium botryosum FD-172 SS1]